MKLIHLNIKLNLSKRSLNVSLRLAETNLAFLYLFLHYFKQLKIIIFSWNWPNLLKICRRLEERYYLEICFYLYKDFFRVS